MMEKYDKAIKLLMEYVKSACKHDGQDEHIPVGISNRHIHLSKNDLDILFGSRYLLTNVKDLLQTGQYACKETLAICGPKGVIEKVRVLGPLRHKTQVEILKGDCFRLGVKTGLRQSGDLDGTPGITLVGPNGSVQIKEGVIVAKRHIHMLPEDALKFGVNDKDNVKIKIKGERGGIFDQVSIRVSNESKLEFHLDTEEANALGVTSKSTIYIVA